MAVIEFHTLTEYQHALDELIAQAHARLRFYDATLENSGFNSAKPYARLRDFCLGGWPRRIEMLVDDPAYLQKHCPRVMHLLRDFSHVLEIRQCDDAAMRPEHAFALADCAGWLRRFDKHALVGQWAANDASGATTLNREFELLWQRAIPSVSFSTLGLG